MVKTHLFWPRILTWQTATASVSHVPYHSFQEGGVKVKIKKKKEERRKKKVGTINLFHVISTLGDELAIEESLFPVATCPRAGVDW